MFSRHLLIEDIRNFDLEENSDLHSNQAEHPISKLNTDDDNIINTSYKYSDHMILKVWDAFINKKHLKFYYGDDNIVYSLQDSLFSGLDLMNIDRKAGLLVNDDETVYYNSDGYSVSICQAVDYANLLQETDESAITSSVEVALRQVKHWNQGNAGSIISKHKILFPYHSGPDHWVLGVITFESEQSALKSSKLEIYDPLGTNSDVNSNVINELEKTLNDHMSGNNMELSFENKSIKQQNDGTSCGAITAENGKDIIDGSTSRINKEYPSGAFELRKQHVDEVNNQRFTEIQYSNRVYQTGGAKIFDNVNDITSKFCSFLNDLPEQSYNEFKNVLEKLKQDHPTDHAKRDISEIFGRYKDDLKRFEIFDWFFSDDSQELKWKDNAYDNLERLIKEKNLLDPSNRKAQSLSQVVQNPNAKRFSGSSERNRQSENQPQQPIVEQQPDPPENRVKRSDDNPQPGHSSNMLNPKQSTADTDQGNTSLHEAALLGDFDGFKSSLEQLKLTQPDNYIDTVNKFNNRRETALSLAIENEHFNIAVYLLKQEDLNPDNQLDKIVRIDSEKFDKLLDHAKKERETAIIDLVSHTASELKRNRHGGDYQLKWLMLFAWQGHSDSRVKFRLGTEVGEADKFDDLVFRYVNSDNEVKYRYLQAKHEQHLGKTSLKISQFTSRGHKYELKKYFTTYLADDPSQVDNLVLCTNNYFDFDPEDFHFQIIDQYTREREGKYKIFSDLGGKLYKFDFKDENDRNGFIKKLFGSDVSPTDKDKIEKFLSKFVFAVEQPNSIKLGKKIKEKMGSNAFNFITYGSFYEYMNEWFSARNEDNTARFILSSEVKGFFDKLKNKIADIELSGLNPLYKNKIKKFIERDLKFRIVKDESENIIVGKDINSIEKFLKAAKSVQQTLKLVYKEEDAFLSIAKVHKVLNQQYTDNTKYTFSDIQSLSSLNFDSSEPRKVIKAFSSENKDLLVIECSFIDEDGENLIKQLYNEVLRRPNTNNKKVIFLLNEGVSGKLDLILQTLSIVPQAIDMENRFSSFDIPSQNELLATKVTFQENEVTLSDLMSIDNINSPSKLKKDNVYQAIDEDSLLKLINKDKVVVGIKRPDLSDLESIYYVTSVKIEEEQLSRAFQNDLSNDLFVISGTTRDEFSKLIPGLDARGENEIRVLGEDNASKENKFIILTDKDDEKNLEDFKRICSNDPERTVHLIEKKSNELTWKRSYDASFYISRELYHAVIKKDSLKQYIEEEPEKIEKKKDVFAVSNIDKEDLKIDVSEEKDLSTDNNSPKKNHVIILEGGEESFKKLCSKDKLKEYYNVHWLQSKRDGENNKLVWKRSEGEVNKIHDLKDESSKFPIKTNDFNKMINTEKAVVIAGEPGMGKSTTLARLLKQPEQFEWIIKLNLIDLQKELKNLGKVSDLNLKSIIKEFFSKVNIGIEEGLAERLLEYRIKDQGKVTLLFDGFDEITDYKDQETVIELLKFLKNTQAKIQITTRLNVKDKLENALSVFSYTFEPFSEKNQKKFLQKFWKASLKFVPTDETVDKAIDEGIEKLFKPFHENIQDKKYEFMSIPLLTRMFAEVYQKTVENFCSSDQDKSQLSKEVKKLSILEGVLKTFK